MYFIISKFLTVYRYKVLAKFCNYLILGTNQHDQTNQFNLEWDRNRYNWEINKTIEGQFL